MPRTRSPGLQGPAGFILCAAHRVRWSCREGYGRRSWLPSYLLVCEMVGFGAGVLSIVTLALPVLFV